jgi:AcrR family transcriptional regulator
MLKIMPGRLNKELEAERPRRGSPEQTRERLIAAAAKVINRAGYHGTDSNRISQEAGYSTGTFYKHFKDKREIFLAAYERWVTTEWKAAGDEISAGGTPEEIARRLIASMVSFHTRWRGLRAALIELTFTDPEVRRFYRAQRRRQLDLIKEIRAGIGAQPSSREADAVLLYTFERTSDAIAHGELKDLGLSREAVIELLVESIRAALA